MNLRSRLTGIATGDQAIFVRRDAFPGFPEIPLMEDIALQQGDEAARPRPPACASACAPRGGAGSRAACCAPILLMWRLRLAVLPRRRPGRAWPRYTAEIRSSCSRARRCPGASKTRLAAAPGRLARRAPARAAYAARVAHRARRALRAGRAACHALARRCSTLRKRVCLQRGGDLGERMYRALSKAREPRDPHRHAIARRSRPRTCAARRAALRGGCDVVLAPAEDGGYALIGARARRARLFEGIAWGTPAGLRARRCKRCAGYRWRALRTRLGRRPARGPRAAQIAPLCFSCSATRSAMTR